MAYRKFFFLGKAGARNLIPSEVVHFKVFPATLTPHNSDHTDKSFHKTPKNIFLKCV